MDEFQSYISAALADGLAEARKFGLNLVLAHQSLSQLHGDRHQAEIAEAVTANAANLVCFRVGLADAMRLALRFEPALSAQDLMRLPNYHAAATFLKGAELNPPVVFTTEPEPKAGRRSRRTSSPTGSAELWAARAAIVRVVAERGQPAADRAFK